MGRGLPCATQIWSQILPQFTLNHSNPCQILLGFTVADVNGCQIQDKHGFPLDLLTPEVNSKKSIFPQVAEGLFIKRL